VVAWRDVVEQHPDGKVLLPPNDSDRPYGENPYAGYDDVDSPPFALDPELLDDRLAPKERVATVEAQGKVVAVPFTSLERKRVLQADVGSIPAVFFFKPGLRSPLDRDGIADGADVGSVSVFDPRLGGRVLSFRARGEAGFVDRQTGSTWDMNGRAVAGSLRGEQLKPLRHDAHFWFAVGAFFPEVKIVRG
jgi:hypothetical protein